MGVNRTLDDADSSVIYNGIWTASGCSTCLTNPSASQRQLLEGGTYHEGLVGPNDATKEAIFLFSGTSVYLYGWRPPSTASQPSIRDSDMSFFLDYAHAGDFKRAASERDEFSFLLFSQSGLAPGPHTLSVTVNPNSVALLDYLIYEELTPAEEADAAAEGYLGGPLPSGADRAANPSSHESVDNTSNGTQMPTASSTPGSQPSANDGESGGANIGLIVGIVSAVLAFLLCGFFIWFILLRRKRRTGELPMATRSQFYIDDDREVLEIKGAPLSRFNTASPAPRTPTFNRVFHDPGTAAHFDSPLSRENTPSPAQFAVQFHNSPPAARSPLAQHEFTPSEYPLPLGPPSEMTYPDTIDVPAAFSTLPVPPPIPPEPRAPSPVAVGGASRRAGSRPASQAAHSVRRLVVYNAPSDISNSDVGHDSAPEAPAPSRSSSRAAERRRRSPPPPLPITSRR